jgi:hypothetical protein
METPAPDAADTVGATDDTKHTDHWQDGNHHQAMEQRCDHSLYTL